MSADVPKQATYFMPNAICTPLSSRDVGTSVRAIVSLPRSFFGGHQNRQCRNPAQIHDRDATSSGSPVPLISPSRVLRGKYDRNASPKAAVRTSDC